MVIPLPIKIIYEYGIFATYKPINNTYVVCNYPCYNIGNDTIITEYSYKVLYNYIIIIFLLS